MAQDSNKKHLKRVLLACVAVAVAALATGGIVAADRLHRRSLLNACRSGDPDAQIEALTDLFEMRDARTAAMAAELLASSQDRQVLAKAAYIAARCWDRQRIPLMLERAAQGPDDPTRARLLLHVGRLAGDDPMLADRFRADLIKSGEPWRQVGAAAALLEMSYPVGGSALMAFARDPDHPGRCMAYAELARIGAMMTETVGWPITWPDTVADTEPAFWRNLADFWETDASSQLVADVLAQRYGADPQWHQLRRLLHARNKVARWFE